MSGSTVVVVGGSSDALDPILRELGLRVNEELAGRAPDVVIAPLLDGGEQLRELRRRHPASELVLLASPEESPAALAAARSVGADVIVLPPERRRTLEILRRALDRRAERTRHEALVDRVRRLDPAIAAEVETLAAESGSRGRALEEAVRLRSSFIANISHEVRTPITVMQGMLEILLEDLRERLSPDELDLFERIRVAGDNLLELVQGILDLAKADAGVLEAKPAQVYFPDLVADLVRKLEPLLAGKPVRLVTDVPRGIEWLTVDGAKLHQLVAALLSNAVRFTDRGEVRLEARLVGGADAPAADDPATLLRAPAPSGDLLEIVVADTGQGITEADRELIFEAFRQADVSATREHQGVGIGLAIAREMARLLGASIRLESRPGAGTRFRLRLPVASVAAPMPEGAPRRSPAWAPRRTADPRGILPELANLLRTPLASREDAVTFALDFVDRFLRPRVTLFAERATRGWAVADVLGRGTLALGPGDALPFPVEALEQSARDRRPVRQATGGGVWSIAAVLDAGEIRGALAAETPEDGDLEDGLRILQIAARWLGLELERERLAEERAEIVALIGRDVKTPLGTLLAYTQSLLRGLCGPLSAEQRPVVLRLERTLHRVILSSLDLLDYQRVGERRLSGAPGPFSLDQVVEHVLARHAAAIELGSYRIQRNVAPDLPQCFGDEVRTDRSISNLFRALLERLPYSSGIRIHAEPSGEFVLCEISAAPSDLAPFLDGLAREAKRPEIGETLGLRLTRAGIESQGGRVELLQAADELTVRLSLPTRQAA